PRLDPDIFHHSIESDTRRLREACLLERHIVRNKMKTTGRNPDVPCHRTVDPVTESFSRRIKVLFALPVHRLVVVDHGCGFTLHPITFFPSRHPFTQQSDPSSELMSQYHRVIYRPTVVCCPLMEVTSAYADIGYFEQNIFITYFRDRNFPKYYRTFLRRKIYYSYRTHLLIL